MWNSDKEPFARTLSYVDDDGEINDDKYQEALEAKWDSMENLNTRSNIYKSSLNKIAEKLKSGEIDSNQFDEMRKDAAYEYSNNKAI